MRTFFATCARGLEYLLRDELVELGASDVREARAGVHFSGTLEVGYKACLESRLASRVLLPLAEFQATDTDALAAEVGKLDWSRHMAPDATMAVDAVCQQSAIDHSRYAAQRVKDAVVDQFRERSGERPSVDLDQPDIRLNLFLKRNQALLSLDLSGGSLHRRGWRQTRVSAPLKENLAAAILLRAGWPAVYRAGGALVDPMCGSGTLLIEGALMAADVAPGLGHEHFGFTAWRGHDEVLWQRLVQAAEKRADAGLRSLQPVFFGSDHDSQAVAAAKRNAQTAGVAGFLQLARHDVGHARPPEGSDKPGLVVCNPPYGERLERDGGLETLYATLGSTLREYFAGWQAAIITSHKELGFALGLRAHKHYQLYNGKLECLLLLFDLASGAPEPAALSEAAQGLANRIDKNRKKLGKRLQREGIGCYRLYDRDLPEYAAAVDVYNARPAGANGADFQPWLHVAEYRAPASVPKNVARKRISELARVLREAFDVPRERVLLKTRQRGKGGTRYAGFDKHGEWLEVREDDLLLRVNLRDHIDTGLFLDHRKVRARLRQLAKGRDMLNLFAYTGSASVHAAAGGASSTTSVDLSKTYLEWAAANLERNGFTGRDHRLVQADARAFLQQGKSRFGLIFVDPPTFSNSARTDEDFDVQRDHVALLEACHRRVARSGVVVFSNNARRFKLDRDALSSLYDIEDWSRQSIPFDFARNPGIHGCWILRTKG